MLTVVNRVLFIDLCDDSNHVPAGFIGFEFRGGAHKPDGGGIRRRQDHESFVHTLLHRLIDRRIRAATGKMVKSALQPISAGVTQPLPNPLTIRSGIVQKSVILRPVTARMAVHAETSR
jgi:hypothetical protein